MGRNHAGMVIWNRVMSIKKLAQVNSAPEMIELLFEFLIHLDQPSPHFAFESHQSMEDVYGFLGGVGGGPLCARSGCDGTVISSCPAGFSHSYSLVPEESEALSGSLPPGGGTPGFRPLAGSGGGGIAGFSDEIWEAISIQICKIHDRTRVPEKAQCLCEA